MGLLTEPAIFCAASAMSCNRNTDLKHYLGIQVKAHNTLHECQDLCWAWFKHSCPVENQYRTIPSRKSIVNKSAKHKHHLDHKTQNKFAKSPKQVTYHHDAVRMSKFLTGRSMYMSPILHSTWCTSRTRSWPYKHAEHCQDAYKHSKQEIKLGWWWRGFPRHLCG